MLKLEDASHYMAFKKALDRRLKEKALQVLKQKWLLGKMQGSLIKKQHLDLLRKVFMAFKMNQLNRINLRETVEQQAQL